MSKKKLDVECAEKSAKQNKLLELENEISKLESTYSKEREQKAQIQKELEETTQRVHAMSTEITTLNKDLSDKTEELDSLEEVQENLSANFRQREAELNQDMDEFIHKLNKEKEEKEKISNNLSSMKELMVIELRKVKDMYESELREVREERDVARSQLQQAGELREQELKKFREESEAIVIGLANNTAPPKDNESQGVETNSEGAPKSRRKLGKRDSNSFSAIKQSVASGPVTTKKRKSSSMYPALEVNESQSSQESPPPKSRPTKETLPQKSDSSKVGKVEKEAPPPKQRKLYGKSSGSQSRQRKVSFDLFEEYEFRD